MSNTTNVQKTGIDHIGESLLSWMFKPRTFFKKNLMLFLIVLAFDILENVISGATSFGYIYSKAVFIATGTTATTLSIIFISLFEGAKIILYVSFFLDILKGEFNGFKFLFVLLVSGFSVLFTYKGTTPMVYTFAKPPVFVPQSEMASVYSSEITNINGQIEHLKANDNASYTLVTAKKIEALNKKKQEYVNKLEGSEQKRTDENEMIEVEQEQTVVLTASSIIYFALALNICSFFLFAPFQAYFFNRSNNERLGVGNAEQKQEQKTYTEQKYTGEQNTGTEQKIPLKFVQNGEHGSVPVFDPSQLGEQKIQEQKVAVVNGVDAKKKMNGS